MAQCDPGEGVAVYFRTLALIAMITPGGAPASPLITSSEETPAQICLSIQEQPARRVEACDTALKDQRITSALRVDLLTAKGEALSAQDLSIEAADALEAALALDPTKAKALTALGWVRRSLGDEEGAFKVFSRALEVDVSIDALAGVAATGRSTGALTQEEVKERLDLALAIDPEDTWVIRELGWLAYQGGDFEQAKLEFERALALSSFDGNAEYGLGRVALATEAPGAALDHFNRVLSEEEHTGARLGRMSALRDLRRNAQAAREAHRFISDYPDRVEGYVQKGRALLALARRADAFSVYEDAEARLGPTNEIAYWYADALAEDGQMARALERIDAALALPGAAAADHLLKSYIALELKDYPVARREAETALSLGPSDPWADFYIAVALIHEGRGNEGIARFDKAIEGGLPTEKVGAFASELIAAGLWDEAVKLRESY